MHQKTEAALDSRMRAALARLTENEKACLRRRLQAQTAKEMALDLGVSPHAVEKRLKMARAKLGVSSSLHAARLLATAEEEYQRPGSPPSDLAASAGSGHSAARRPGRPNSIVVGVTMISIIATAALAAATLSGSADPAEPSLAKIFQALDRDGSGYIETSEYARAAGPQGSTDWLAKRDTNRDGKVSQAELGAGAVVRDDPAAPRVLVVERN